MMNWKWTIGSAPAAIAPGGVVVLENGYEQLAHRLWEMLNADAGLGRILQEITAASNADLESLPSFVVMIHNGDSEHIAVRGSFDIDLHAGGQTHTISGASLITWSEQRDIRAEGWRIRSTLAAIDPVATEWAASSGVLPVHTLSFGSEGSESSDKEGDTAALSADSSSDSIVDTDGAPLAEYDTPVADLDYGHEGAASAVMTGAEDVQTASDTPEMLVAPATAYASVKPLATAPEEPMLAPVDHSAQLAEKLSEHPATQSGDLVGDEVAESAQTHESFLHPVGQTMLETEQEREARIGDTNKDVDAESLEQVSDTANMSDEEVPSLTEAESATPTVEEAAVSTHSEQIIEHSEVVDEIGILNDDTPMGEDVTPEVAPLVAAVVEDAPPAAAPLRQEPSDAAAVAEAVPTNISEEYPAEFTSGKFFIDSVPAEFIPSDTQSAPDDAEGLGDHAGDTVMVPSATVTDPQEEEEVPQILAILCEDGHPNPTHVKQCRVCEKPMSRNLVRVPRPPLGSLIFSTGEVVSLDRDVVVGRRPSAKSQEGRLEPRLVALPSPNREISRNHCEIRVDGWDIRIRDLGSNNGTFLTREGQEPLRVGEAFPVILRNGDTIDLGESITIRLEY